MTSEDGQKMMDDWFNNLPVEIEIFYTFLSDNVKKFQTFDLLSYFSYYNHLNNIEQYSDFRGDKSFIASEVLALLCLKNEFVNKSTVSQDDYMDLMMEIQKTVLNYCGRNDALEMNKGLIARGEDVISGISNSLLMEAKQIRNLGLPDHHFIFIQKLFEPIKDEVQSLFGFSVSDSIIIRTKLTEMINIKSRVAIDNALDKASKHAKEIVRYRKTKTVETNSIFTQEQLEEYSKYSDKKIKQGLQTYFLTELYYTFSNIYTFTEEELSDFTRVELDSVKSFLKTFSCGFPSLNAEDKIYEPVSILKKTPIIEHKGRYLIPSFPLLIWAVEDVLEAEINKSQKLRNKYKIVKHDFLLNHGLKFFKTLLPTATFFPPNLFYYLNNDRCETDGLILYDKILFIIEAKGHRITPRAKKGFADRTEKHLKEIIQESYRQGIRTLKHVEEARVAKFKTKSGEEIIINREDIDDIVIVSLTLEPVGSVSMSIKATNDIGYFKNEHFPWIISIYDLVVLADLFENPMVLVHYIKRRRKFLSHKLISIYEELDLISYFLFNGLFIEQTLKDAEENNIGWTQFAPETDAINDYYMYKFGHKKRFTPKPKHFISKEFNDFLLQLDCSRMPHRVRMALLFLEFDNKSIKQLMDSIKNTKKVFSKDNGIHDCSIFTHSFGGIGITFMTGKNRKELDFQLHQYCNYKLHQLSANIWMGLGDVSLEKNVYKFQSMFFAMKKGMPTP